jgi:hypothetical protein
MATKGGSKIFWIIGGLIVVAGSVGAYFLLRKPKDEGTGDTDTNTDTDTNVGGGNVGGGGATKTYTAPSELNDSTKIKAFQDWMDVKGKGWIPKNGTWVLLNKGAGYGNYGENTDNVWKFYGAEYVSSKKGTLPTPIKNTEKPDSADVKTILGYAKGRTEKGLNSFSKGYIKDWADAIRNRLSTHTWSNQVYSTLNGEVLIPYDQTKFVHYVTKKGQYYKATDDLDATAYTTTIGDDLGKLGRAVRRFNTKGVGYTLIYVPKKEMWIYADAVSRTKPSSSFMGSDMDLDMFASFDNNLDLNL